LSKWLTQSYFWRPGTFPEWAYKFIAPCIVVEEFLISKSGQGVPPDYRFFIFNGICEYVEVDKSWSNQLTRTMFDRNWNAIDVKLKYPPAFPLPIEPDEFKLMVKLAEKLANGIDHVRCDFYLVDSRIVFGELTNYHVGGLQEITISGDKGKFGQSWHPDTHY
jgi:hypothetical protein